METVIKVNGLGKRYKIGKREKYLTLRDRLTQIATSPYKLFSGKALLNKPHIWALKDVSFEVKRGEVIGVIGKNGAGKTTLLKILSRITEPTTGKVTLNGRVSSLLEVGTGFHPELTGRENIYLNGAILGMKKKEIDRKFNAISNFSGVEKFLDTPVKRYSSGMYVRLAFAVAAHLEPEIMLVDEVLAVGDVAFQKKCIGKMKDVATSGRTVLFVSHNMAAVKNLCSKCILLKDGKIDAIGETDKIINKYLKIVDKVVEVPVGKRKDRKGDGSLKVTKIYFEDNKGGKLEHLKTGQDLKIIVQYISSGKKPISNVSIGLSVDNKNSARIFQLWNGLTGDFWERIPSKGSFICHIPKLPLVSGDYYFTVSVRIDEIIADWVLHAKKIKVENGDFFKWGQTEKNEGDFLVEHSWDFKKSD